MNNEIEFSLGRLDSRLFNGDDPSDILEPLGPLIAAEKNTEEIVSLIRDRSMFVDVDGNQEAICEWIRAIHIGDGSAADLALGKLTYQREC